MRAELANSATPLLAFLRGVQRELGVASDVLRTIGATAINFRTVRAAAISMATYHQQYQHEGLMPAPASHRLADPQSLARNRPSLDSADSTPTPPLL
jgi:hypothetical protein